MDTIKVLFKMNICMLAILVGFYYIRFMLGIPPSITDDINRCFINTVTETSIDESFKLAKQGNDDDLDILVHDN